MTRHVDDIIADVIVVMVVRPAEGGPAGEHDARDAAAAAAAAAAADGRGVGEAEAAGGTRRRARVRSDQLTLRVHSGFPSRDWLSFVQVAMALQQQQQQQQLAQVVVREQAMWEMQRMREEQLREQKHREEAMREQQVGQITRKSVAFATRGGEVASHQMEHNGKQRGQACEHKWCGLVPLVARVEVAGQCSFWICPLGTRSSCDMKCCDDVGRSSAGGQMWERRMREQQQAEEQQRRQKQQAELLKQQHQQQQQQQQQTDLRCSCLSSNTTACCEHPFFSGHVTRAMFFLWRWVRDVSTSAVGTGAEGGDGAPAAAAAAPDHGQHGGCTPKPPDQHVTPVFINA
eukprot:1185834-Prorocentrum_minimum.AAC.3